MTIIAMFIFFCTLIFIPKTDMFHADYYDTLFKIGFSLLIAPFIAIECLFLSVCISFDSYAQFDVETFRSIICKGSVVVIFFAALSAVFGIFVFHAAKAKNHTEEIRENSRIRSLAAIFTTGSYIVFCLGAAIMIQSFRTLFW